MGKKREREGDRGKKIRKGEGGRQVERQRQRERRKENGREEKLEGWRDMFLCQSGTSDLGKQINKEI